jgi:ABC-type phosphate transport system auxiliary subunit
MSGEFKRVEGSGNLYKNLATGTVINTNVEEIRLARKRKEINREKANKNKQMEGELADLKSEISELKDLIKELVGK